MGPCIPAKCMLVHMPAWGLLQVLRSMAEQSGGASLGERELQQALGIIAALAGEPPVHLGNMWAIC